MAAENFTFNIAKGRVCEFFNRAKAGDPGTCALVLVPMTTANTAAEGQDADSLAAVEALANFAEAGAAWGRKTLGTTELSGVTFAPNDTDNRFDVALPSVTWTAPAAANNTQGLLVCYDANTGAGADSDIIPLTCHIFAVTTDGNDVILNAGDFFHAS